MAGCGPCLDLLDLPGRQRAQRQGVDILDVPEPDDEMRADLRHAIDARAGENGLASRLGHVQAVRPETISHGNGLVEMLVAAPALQAAAHDRGLNRVIGQDRYGNKQNGQAAQAEQIMEKGGGKAARALSPTFPPGGDPHRQQHQQHHPPEQVQQTPPRRRKHVGKGVERRRCPRLQVDRSHDPEGVRRLPGGVPAWGCVARCVSRMADSLVFKHGDSVAVGSDSPDHLNLRRLMPPPTFPSRSS